MIILKLNIKTHKYAYGILISFRIWSKQPTLMNGVIELRVQ